MNSMTYGTLPDREDFGRAFKAGVPGESYRIRNDKVFFGDADLSERELWDWLSTHGTDWAFPERMDLASSILSTLGFEWV